MTFEEAMHNYLKVTPPSERAFVRAHGRAMWNAALEKAASGAEADCCKGYCFHPECRRVTKVVAAIRALKESR